MTVLAGDFGGTQLKLGIVRAGGMLACAVEPSFSHLGLAPRLPVIAATWRRLLQELTLEPADCAGISIAFPSLVDRASGRVLVDYGKFADAPGLDLRAWADREFALPLAIENDARLALIGEWRAGAGAGCDNLVMITLGTGLGVCAVIEGRLLRGRHGQAGVLGGHITVRHGGRLCTCGNRGCAEAEASTSRLREIAAETAGFADSPLRHAQPLDYLAVFHHAAAGDSCALALREHSLAVWGSLAVSLIHVCDPEMLILGGGIMAGADVVLPAVSAFVQQHAHTPWGRVQVVASSLGNSAALIGGEWLVGELTAAGREHPR